MSQSTSSTIQPMELTQPNMVVISPPPSPDPSIDLTSDISIGSVCQTPRSLQGLYPNLVNSDVTNIAINNRHGICGQNYYIAREPNSLCPIGCAPCFSDTSPRTPIFPGYASDMCSSDLSTWWHSQNEANMNNTPENIWKKVNTVLSVYPSRLPLNEEQAALEVAKEWYINRMDDSQLINRMFSLSWTPSVGELPDKNDYDQGDPEAIRRVNDALVEFKNVISNRRGSSVTCVEPNGGNVVSVNDSSGTPHQLFDLGDDWDPAELIGEQGRLQPRWDGCNNINTSSQGTLYTFGSKNISTREYEEWSSEYLRNKVRDSPSLGNTKSENLNIHGGLSSNIIGAELYPINQPFENCINELLTEYKDDIDAQMIHDINRKTEITDLVHEEVEFIKRKLELLIISKSRISVKQCILDHILKDKNDCPDNLPQQMMVILNILFSTIGFNLQLNTLNQYDENEMTRLKEIINQLGDLIPRALDKIIDIAEEIEINNCDGNISHNTQILKEMNDKLFNSQKKTVHFDMNLPSVGEVIKMTDIDKLFDKNEVNDDQFQRLTILGAVAIAVLKFI